jgi:selenocysteine lyase/cysteine desulfurase
MVESVKLLRELGIEAIRVHLAEIQRPLLEWAARRGVAVNSPRGARGSGIVCVAPPRVAEAARALRKARIYCSQREGAVRLSPHCYNTSDELERVATVLDGAL